MKRNASKKGGGNLEGLLMFGDALPPELVAGAKALGMGGMGFAQGLLAEGGNVGAGTPPPTMGDPLVSILTPSLRKR